MIDFHCHCDLYPNPQEVLAETVRRDIQVLSVTTTPSAWHGTSQLASGLSSIRTALGLHPQIAHERHTELALFQELLPVTRFVGEVGLDGSRELLQHREVQERVFRRILALCAGVGGRVMSIHSRNAASPVLDCLAEFPSAGVAVLHWFSGTSRELERAIRLDCWFSVGPSMLASRKGRSLFAQMPRERVLTETDGPFTKAGGRSLVPWDVAGAVTAIAEVWHVTPASARSVIGANHTRLLAESEPAPGDRSSG